MVKTKHTIYLIWKKQCQVRVCYPTNLLNRNVKQSVELQMVTERTQTWKHYDTWDIPAAAAAQPLLQPAAETAWWSGSSSCAWLGLSLSTPPPASEGLVSHPWMMPAPRSAPPAWHARWYPPWWSLEVITWDDDGLSHPWRKLGSHMRPVWFKHITCTERTFYMTASITHLVASFIIPHFIKVNSHERAPTPSHKKDWYKL